MRYTKWDDISFISRSKNRANLLNALKEPKTPTQLSKELSLNIGYISNLIIDLLKRKLIVCLTPNEKRYRLYKISKKGENIIKSINN